MRGFASAFGGVIASVLALSAAANEPTEITTSGRARVFAFAVDQNATPPKPVKDVNGFSNAALYFDTKTIFDNGVDFRTTAELTADQTNLFTPGLRSRVRADRFYADAITAFGKFRVGKREGTNTSTIEDATLSAFLTPYEEIIGDALKPQTSVTTRDAVTFKRFADQAFGVTYETPAIIQGVKLGISYHPSTGTDDRTINRNISARDGLDVTARYEGRYSGGTYRIAGGVFRAQSRGALRNGVEAWNANVGLTYGGLETSLTYLSSQPSNNRDERTWSISALYGIGPFKISADYMNAVRDGLAPTTPEKVSKTSLQGNYRYSRNVSFGIAGFYARQRDTAGKIWQGPGIISGVKVSF